MFFKTLCYVFEMKQVKVGWSNAGVLPWLRKASPRGEQPLAVPCPGAEAAAVQTGGFFVWTEVCHRLKQLVLGTQHLPNMCKKSHADHL